MSFVVSHIFRERNACADRLVKFGIDNQGSHWWDLTPNFIRDDVLGIS